MKSTLLFIVAGFFTSCAELPNPGTAYEQAYHKSQRDWDSFNIEQTHLDQQTAAFNQQYGFK